MDDRRSEITVTALTSCTSSTFGVTGFYPFSETLMKMLASGPNDSKYLSEIFAMDSTQYYLFTVFILLMIWRLIYGSMFLLYIIKKGLKVNNSHDLIIRSIVTG
jgi:hypothetical protein